MILSAVEAEKNGTMLVLNEDGILQGSGMQNHHYWFQTILRRILVAFCSYYNACALRTCVIDISESRIGF